MLAKIDINVFDQNLITRTKISGANYSEKKNQKTHFGVEEMSNKTKVAIIQTLTKSSSSNNRLKSYC